jgi:deoxyhypusine synthase
MDGRIVAVVGSGPNIHEGVTTLIAELIHKGLVDGVSTSSAVVSHEMAGALEKVKRIKGEDLGIDRDLLPIDGRLEVSLLGLDQLHAWEA